MANPGDSVIITAREVKGGFDDFYYFHLDTSALVRNLTQPGDPGSNYSILLQKEMILKGHTDFPVPLCMGQFNPKTDSLPKISDIFFLENGEYTIHLPRFLNKMEINPDSPANHEYKALKKLLAPVYVRSELYQEIDKLIDFDQKQKILSAYIRQHPDSYVALWQLIEDAEIKNGDPVYLSNLRLFSKKVKESRLYKMFLENLGLPNESDLLPDIHFDDQQSLTTKDFSQHKLTFIYYWTSTCEPCVKELPLIVDLYNEFKNKGLNVITVSDESTPASLTLSKRLLKDNKAEWINYPDPSGKFKTALGTSTYPLQLLINQEGKIITQVSGDLNEIRKTVKKHLN